MENGLTTLNQKDFRTNMGKTKKRMPEYDEDMFFFNTQKDEQWAQQQYNNQIGESKNAYMETPSWESY